MDQTTLLSLLKEKGCRMTPQRLSIIELLIDYQKSLLSVDDLLIMAKEINPQINATTIYRNIELLDGLDMLYTHNSKDGSKLYKLICHTTHHHHIICSACGKMLPIDYCPIAPQLEAMVAEKGFTLESHSLDLYGLCPDCQTL